MKNKDYLDMIDEMVEYYRLKFTDAIKKKDYKGQHLSLGGINALLKLKDKILEVNQDD